MTTSRRRSAPTDPEPSLHLSRAEKFQLLRAAVAAVRASRRNRGPDLFRFVEAVELRTVNDGRCHLLQQDLAELLGWGRDKLREVRDELRALGWCEVINGHPDYRGGKAGVLRLEWPKIAAAAGRPKRPAPMPENPSSKTDFSASHIKDSFPHDFPNEEPHEAYAPESAWPKAIRPEDLRSDDWLQRHHELRCRRFRIPDCEAERLAFFTCAEVSLEKGRKAGALFTAMLKRPAAERRVSDRAEERARRRILAFDRSRRLGGPRVPPPPSAFDPDVAAAAERDRRLAAAELFVNVAAVAAHTTAARPASPAAVEVPPGEGTNVDAASVGGGPHQVNHRAETSP